jgi:hypothetical protein
MREIFLQKISKKGCILLLTAVVVFSTIVSAANTGEESSKYVRVNVNGFLSDHPQNSLEQDWFAWLHYDGDNYDAIGYSGGMGIWETAVRFTPTELSEYTGYNLTTVQVFHGWVTGPPQPAHNGVLKIYDAGTSTSPGLLLYQKEFLSRVGNGWFNITLDTPVVIAGNKDLWVSIEWTMIEFTYPAGCDSGPHVPGKGDWVWNEEDGWGELCNHSAFDVNWNIRAKVIISEPPTVPQQPQGPMQGVVGQVYSFSTNSSDPEGGGVLYQWDWGDNSTSDWLGPFASGELAIAFHSWTTGGSYEIKVRAKDLHDAMSNWSEPLGIAIGGPVLDIGIVSGGPLKVRTVIKNTGAADALRVNWSIVLDGGFILLGKQTSGSVLTIPVGKEVVIVSDFIFGFGKTVITVRADTPGSSDSLLQDAFVFLFIVKI